MKLTINFPADIEDLEIDVDGTYEFQDTLSDRLNDSDGLLRLARACLVEGEVDLQLEAYDELGNKYIVDCYLCSDVGYRKTESTFDIEFDGKLRCKGLEAPSALQAAYKWYEKDGKDLVVPGNKIVVIGEDGKKRHEIKLTLVPKWSSL